MLFWIWTTLLQFNCANQAYSGDEDLVNKPWRPVPARRITPESTARLRWIMFCFNVCFSASLGRNVLYTTIFLTIAEYLYNEMKFSEHPVLKNLCNVFGYGGFETGATLIACEYNQLVDKGLDTYKFLLAPNLSLDEVAVRALVLSCALIFTTIHAQDFPDREGDKLAGRKTLPILFPEASRVYIAVVLVAWSIALSLFWGLGLICSAVFVAAGSFIAWKFFTERDVESDERTYLIYNVSLLYLIKWNLQLTNYFTGMAPLRSHSANKSASQHSLLLNIERFHKRTPINYCISSPTAYLSATKAYISTVQLSTTL